MTIAIGSRNGTINHNVATAQKRDLRTAALWTAQAALALLFIFAGATKLVMSGDDITGDTGLPVLFMRGIGVLELLGGIGVIAPAVLRFNRFLTPLAAIGLVGIMIGATIVTLIGGMIAGALLPFAVGVVAANVAYARRSWLTR